MPIIISFIGLVLTISATFDHRTSVQYRILAKRTARSIIVFGPLFLGYIAIVIDLIVDGVFGSGASVERKFPSTKSSDPENNRGRLKQPVPHVPRGFLGPGSAFTFADIA